MIDLSICKHAFLQHQSNARTIRIINLPAHRGMITDRKGVPLAISIPVDAVWANPRLFTASAQQLHDLARLLHLPYSYLEGKINENSRRWFVYLKRHVTPGVTAKIKALHIPGLFYKREYRRYYPEGEISAHVVGFTNIDDKGQEGLELAYNSWLSGISGQMKVLKDRLGHIVAIMNTMHKPQQGNGLTLSIDERIQYLAYLELKKTVKKYHAASGSIVVLDVKTGEVLAMVNQPSYNPNDRPSKHDGRYRNRAITDTFEPGSTMKTFSIVSALESGKYRPNTKVDTNPGWFMVDGNTIKDEGVNHGILTVTGVLQKSSNIGIAKMTLSLPPENLWRVLHVLGFGERTAIGFPGEAAGVLEEHRIWRPFVLATLSFGYAMSATPLQLACAYAVIANDGAKLPVSFLKVDKAPQGDQVISTKVAKEMLKMLHTVVEAGGTGMQARVPGYTVAGKTGTAYIAGKHGYDKKRYIADFVGMAPVNNPRLVVAVVVRDPHGQHFGGLVAAPAFAHVMGGALRMLNVSPDNLKQTHVG
ncbi:MAG: penicillin-binding protein 2 [Gammaproteobacteria bacterium]|nr:penicillin-binding protein 2 [Gammaproteobacteria bacterium]